MGRAVNSSQTCMLAVGTIVICLPRSWKCWHPHLHVPAALMEMGLQREYEAVLLPGSPVQTPHTRLHSTPQSVFGHILRNGPSLRKTFTLSINVVLFRAESTCFSFALHFYKIEAAAFIQMELSFLNQITSVNEVNSSLP